MNKKAGKNKSLTIEDHAERSRKLSARARSKPYFADLMRSIEIGYRQLCGNSVFSRDRIKLDPKVAEDKIVIDNALLVGHVLGIDAQIIIGLIKCGAISRWISLETDWVLLTMALPQLGHDKQFIRMGARTFDQKTCEELLLTVNADSRLEARMILIMFKNPGIQWRGHTDKTGIRIRGMLDHLKIQCPNLFFRKYEKDGFPSSAELAEKRRDEENDRVKKNERNAHEIWRRLKDRQRKGQQDEGTFRLTPRQLEWQIYHLRSALDQSSAPEEIKEKILRLIEKNRLRRLETINQFFQDLGIAAPEPYQHYVSPTLGSKLGVMLHDLIEADYPVPPAIKAKALEYRALIEQDGGETPDWIDILIKTIEPWLQRQKMHYVH